MLEANCFLLYVTSKIGHPVIIIIIIIIQCWLWSQVLWKRVSVKNSRIFSWEKKITRWFSKHFLHLDLIQAFVYYLETFVFCLRKISNWQIYTTYVLYMEIENILIVMWRNQITKYLKVVTMPSKWPKIRDEKNFFCLLKLMIFLFFDLLKLLHQINIGLFSFKKD